MFELFVKTRQHLSNPSI